MRFWVSPAWLFCGPTPGCPTCLLNQRRIIHETTVRYVGRHGSNRRGCCGWRVGAERGVASFNGFHSSPVRVPVRISPILLLPQITARISHRFRCYCAAGDAKGEDFRGDGGTPGCFCCVNSDISEHCSILHTRRKVGLVGPRIEPPIRVCARSGAARAIGGELARGS